MLRALVEPQARDELRVRDDFQPGAEARVRDGLRGLAGPSASGGSQPAAALPAPDAQPGPAEPLEQAGSAETAYALARAIAVRGR